ncbi:MAG: outer membrane lipoprotein carrier protein LolA [Acidipila sp.]|nr:outer membrane lipoprotein carrier protein LolA [Acidipila sp.]
MIFQFKTVATRFGRLASLAVLLCAMWPAQFAQAQDSQTVESVIDELDHAAKGFHSVSGDVERTKVTVVVNDHSTESGQIFVRRDDKMRIELTKPDVRTILRNGDTLWVYVPKTKRLEEYNLGKQKGLVDQLLLLGLDSSGGDLKKHYLLTVLSEPTLDGKKTVLLELTPKDEKIRNQIARIHLWIDTSNWLALQQKFFETGSEDYFIIHYSNLVRNLKLPDSKFKQDWPKDVHRIKPQG